MANHAATFNFCIWVGCGTGAFARLRSGMRLRRANAPIGMLDSVPKPALTARFAVASLNK